MNLSIIRRILGYVLLLEGVFLLLPCFVALYYGESQGFSFLAVSGLCALAGFALAVKKPLTMFFI